MSELYNQKSLFDYLGETKEKIDLIEKLFSNDPELDKYKFSFEAKENTIEFSATNPKNVVLSAKVPAGVIDDTLKEAEPVERQITYELCGRKLVLTCYAKPVDGTYMKMELMPIEK